MIWNVLLGSPRMSPDDLFHEALDTARYRPEKDFLLNHVAFQALMRRLLTLEAHLEALEGNPAARPIVEDRFADRLSFEDGSSELVWCILFKLNWADPSSRPKAI